MLRALVRRTLALACLLSIAACGDRAPAPSPALSAAVEPPWPGLSLDLIPDPARGELAVEVRVGAARAASIRELGVARAWADTRGTDAIAGVRLRDAAGDVPLQPRADPGGPDDVFDLGRPPRGDLLLSYRAHAGAGRSRFALHVTDDRVSGVGHAFLLLPRIDEPIPARIRIHTRALRRGAEAASSFGFGGEVVTTAASEDLAHAVYVAGMLWREGRGDGGPSLVVLGDPPFDTRTAFERATAGSDAVDRFFGGAPSPPGSPFMFVLVAQPGLGPAREGAYLTRSVGLWFDARQKLDAALELVLAHEITHRYLGGALRLTGPDGREAAWFSEGFTVHFARRALLAAGLLTPADYVADLDRTLGDDGPAAERLPADYTRGAVYAAWFDAAVRRASKGRRSLDDVIRELLAAARAGGSPSLPVAALRDALARDIGREAAARVDRIDARDSPLPELPDDAFGPCARRTVRERTGFELGFERASLETRPALIRGLVRGSAAERAGVREGALVISSRIPGDGGEVELLLAEGKRVRYRPVATKREIHWETAPCKLPAPVRD
jgi:predicted metalloprotease with PDZ domain